MLSCGRFMVVIVMMVNMIIMLMMIMCMTVVIIGCSTTGTARSPRRVSLPVGMLIRQSTTMGLQGGEGGRRLPVGVPVIDVC